MLENSVKKQLLDRCEHIHVVVEEESQRAALNLDLRRSVSVACGASIVELKIKAPTWIGQACQLPPLNFTLEILKIVEAFFLLVT